MSTVVHLKIEVRPEGSGFVETTSWKAEPIGLDVDQVKSKLRLLVDELEGQGRLDLDENGEA